MLLGSSQGIEAASSHEGEHVQRTVFRTALVADCGRYIVQEYKQESVFLNSSELEDFFQRTRVRVGREDFNPIMISPDTASRLGIWTEAPAPQVLWLSGPYTQADTFDNPMSTLAAKIISLAARNGLPLVTYFCELRRREPLRPGNSTKESQAMITLLYAIVRQVVELLPPLFEADVDLSKTRFHQLDGTIRSWEHALSMFRDLLSLIPRTAVCIIDGIQWLDDRSTKTNLKELVQVLRSEKLKVLFTTAGSSRCLLAELSSSESLEFGNLDPKKAVSGFGRERLSERSSE